MFRFFSIVAMVSGAVPALADPLALTVDEFKMYQHYKNALEDPRVQKMKPESRVGAIAKDAGFKLKDLKQAIERGEAAGDIKGACEANIQTELAKTELAGRIGKVEVDVSDPHAIAYLMWLNEDPAKLDVEACFAAAAGRAGCPIVSTVQVWSQSKNNPDTRVFQALISGSAAANIRPDRVKDFAATRYVRLFEKRKSVNNGDEFPSGDEAPAVKAGQQ